MIVKVSSKFGTVIAQELRTVDIHAAVDTAEEISSIPDQTLCESDSTENSPLNPEE